MAHARLARGERGIRIEVEVGAQDLVESAVDDDRTIHLGELEKSVAREGNVQRKAIVAGGKYGLGIAHADERADVARDDHIEGGPQRLPRGGEANGLFHALVGAFLFHGGPPLITRSSHCRTNRKASSDFAEKLRGNRHARAGRDTAPTRQVERDPAAALARRPSTNERRPSAAGTAIDASIECGAKTKSGQSGSPQLTACKAPCAATAMRAASSHRDFSARRHPTGQGHRRCLQCAGRSWSGAAPRRQNPHRAHRSHGERGFRRQHG